MIVGVVIVYSFLLGILSNFPLAELGGAVFADVTSANVVGYNTSEQITKEYNEMIAGAFSGVSNDGKFTLAALKGTGYAPSTSVDIGGGMIVWSGGCGMGQIELQVLNPNGTAKASYFWADCKTGIEGINYEEYTPGWYKKISGPSGVQFIKLTDGEIAELEFDQGQAFWVASILETGKIVSAGAVPTKSIEFLTIKEYNIAAGNGMPVDYTLGNLMATGYSPSTSVDMGGLIVWSGGCGTGQFELQVLNPNGTAKASYFWVDCKTGIVGINYEEYTPGWYRKVIDSGSGAINFIKLNADELAAVKAPASKGFWIARLGDEPIKFFVPAPELH